MARIAILTCSNCTQDSNCASVVCLGDMRKRRGFFAPYPQDQPLDLIGIINCAGCPTLAAPAWDVLGHAFIMEQIKGAIKAMQGVLMVEEV